MKTTAVEANIRKLTKTARVDMYALREMLSIQSIEEHYFHHKILDGSARVVQYGPAMQQRLIEEVL